MAHVLTGPRRRDRGLVTHYVLLAIEIATRAVEIAGVTTNPDAPFMARIARNLTDHVDGFLRDKRHVVLDRDSKFTAQFRAILEAAGVAPIFTAVRAPNMNAFAERFVRTIQDECLSKMIFVGEGMLHRALREFVAHYHEERNHQGKGLRLLQPQAADLGGDGPVVCRERLGGMLSYYHRKRRAS